MPYQSTPNACECQEGVWAVQSGKPSFIPTGLSDFTDRQEKLLYMVYRNEGGYTCLKGDSGGETYRGIARNFHPRWTGWNVIDRMKAEQHVTQLPRNTDIPELQNAVYQFYFDNFYKPMRIDDYKDVVMAGLVYHRGVGMGTSVIGKLVTRAVNRTKGSGFPEPENKKHPADNVMAVVNGNLSSHVTENFVIVAKERYLEIDNAKKAANSNYPGYYNSWCNSIYKDIEYLKSNFR